MNEAEAVLYLTTTQMYTGAEARAELDSLVSGECEALEVTGPGEEDRRLVYDAEAGMFVETEEWREDHG